MTGFLASVQTADDAQVPAVLVVAAVAAIALTVWLLYGLPAFRRAQRVLRDAPVPRQQPARIYRFDAPRSRRQPDAATRPLDHQEGVAHVHRH